MPKTDAPKPTAKLETVTLRAFIHCEGCRRKIRRIIRIVDGVEDVVVDTPTGKITVTGTSLNVNAIIQRLQKHGKQAETWSNLKGGPSATPANVQGGSQAKSAAGGNAGSNAPGSNSKKKNNAGGNGGGGGKSGAPPGGNGNNKTGSSKKEGEEVPSIIKEGDEMPASDSAETGKEKPEKNVEPKSDNVSKQEGETLVTVNGGGKKGKKAGNGSMNGSNGGGERHTLGSSNPEQPPHPHVMETPIFNAPVVTVSANKGRSTYDAVRTGYAEYNTAEYATHMFSDENANSCSVM
ncbi:hypothetical protein KP509_16G045500 [Ceratopteris richardii]|uniref:HMA domain-containing protein n=1 Tax=Ceratopteris richardii TaxID=49495 RepID=A0A8T2SYG8_CERRI|nr:hypothetical protein KP509_16G045500 [Ceratopteris richardii]